MGQERPSPKPVLGVPRQADDGLVTGLVSELNLPEAVAAILVRRGHGDPDAARAFLRPRLSHLLDPWRMAGMKEAVDRIAHAIDRGETVLVHGDYDVDGVCGSAMLVRALRELGARAEPFVPNRLLHGYDLGPAGVARAVELRAGCILTCDCGTVAHDAIAAARQQGIDVVVSDHHTPAPSLPPAICVLNPHRADCEYPERVLCGSGVAFKFLQALFERGGRPTDKLNKYLDLVAIATIADLVPLSGENRVLARFGLKVLERTRNTGLRALLQVAGLEAGRPINAGQIAFVIGPRLNAAGRMGDAMRGVRLLLTEDPAEARALAMEIDSENRHRQEVDRATLEQAKELLERTFDPERDRAIVLSSDDWHPGVIGIVASRVVEQYFRPTFLIALDGERGRGSGRSIPGFHLYEALRECADHLEQFGGHRAAAGLQIRRGKVDAFRARFDAVARERLKPEDLRPRLYIDHELSIAEVSPELWRILAHFGPYGQGNPRPVFLARNVRLAAEPAVVGEDHLRLRLEAGGGAASEAIGFGLAAESEWLRHAKGVDLAFQIGLKEWQGIEYVQARVLDVRPTETAWATSGS